MARIRTIKPEFPQSESMGNVSRDARLTFLLLLTVADDDGRGRGNSKLLAGLLFPYDQDAPKKIDGWLSELESQNSIRRYSVGGHSYFQILNWHLHQKIDRPSKSKFPPPPGPGEDAREDSRGLASDLEGSSLDQGSRIKDQGRDHLGAEKTKTKRRRFKRPTVEEVAAYCNERGNGIDPEAFLAHYDANGWVRGRNRTPVKNWRACIVTWERNRKGPVSASRVPSDQDLANWNAHDGGQGVQA